MPSHHVRWTVLIWHNQEVLYDLSDIVRYTRRAGFWFCLCQCSMNNKMRQVLGVVQKELFTVPWWHALNVNRQYLARFTAGILPLLLFELLSKNESYCQIWWTATVSCDKFGHNSTFTAGHHCNDNAKEINLWPWLNECKHEETSTKVPSAHTRINH